MQPRGALFWKIRIMCLPIEMLWCLSSGGTVCKVLSMVPDIIKTQYTHFVINIIVFKSELTSNVWNIHIWRAYRFCIQIGSIKHLMATSKCRKRQKTFKIVFVRSWHFLSIKKHSNATTCIPCHSRFGHNSGNFFVLGLAKYIMKYFQIMNSDT